MEDEVYKNKSEELYCGVIADISKFLHGIGKREIIPLNMYEGQYKILRATKRFYDGETWDNIGKKVKERWFKECRADEQFKKYYKLRQELDRLEVLVK